MTRHHKRWHAMLDFTVWQLFWETPSLELRTGSFQCSYTLIGVLLTFITSCSHLRILHYSGSDKDRRHIYRNFRLCYKRSTIRRKGSHICWFIIVAAIRTTGKYLLCFFKFSSFNGRNEKCIQKFNSEKLKGRDKLGNLGVDGRKISKSIFNKYYVRMWTALIWLGIPFCVGLLWSW
jgi:hypothetical protein